MIYQNHRNIGYFVAKLLLWLGFFYALYWIWWSVEEYPNGRYFRWGSYGYVKDEYTDQGLDVHQNGMLWCLALTLGVAVVAGVFYWVAERNRQRKPVMSRRGWRVTKVFACIACVACLVKIWGAVGNVSSYSGGEKEKSYTIYRWAVDYHFPEDTFIVNSIGVQQCVLFTVATLLLFVVVMRICIRWQKQEKVLTSSQWKIAGWIGIPILLLAFLATSFWGVEDVKNDYLMQRTSDMGFVKGRGDVTFKMLEYNPEQIRADRLHVESPWSYVAEESTVMPFVVSLEYGYRAGDLDGAGYQVYVFWCFGYKIPIYSKLRWLS